MTLTTNIMTCGARNENHCAGRQPAVDSCLCDGCLLRFCTFPLIFDASPHTYAGRAGAVDAPTGVRVPDPSGHPATPKASRPPATQKTKKNGSIYFGKPIVIGKARCLRGKFCAIWLLVRSRWYRSSLTCPLMPTMRLFSKLSPASLCSADERLFIAAHQRRYAFQSSDRVSLYANAIAVVHVPRRIVHDAGP